MDDDDDKSVNAIDANKVADILSQLLAETRLNTERQEAFQAQLLGENALETVMSWITHIHGLLYISEGQQVFNSGQKVQRSYLGMILPGKHMHMTSKPNLGQ